MSIPDFQTVMLPLLEVLSDGQIHTMRAVTEALASRLGLTDEERRQLLPSGQQTVFSNRVGWAKTHMKMDGRPVAGARLFLTLGLESQAEPATSGAEGRFRFTVPREKFGDAWTVVAATAPGYGVGFEVVPADGRRDDLTIRLVDDGAPITGQILNPEGKPVPGVSVRVERIDAADGEDLHPWLEAVRAKSGRRKPLFPRSTYAVTTQVTTDAAGRFRLTGIGRDRLATLRLSGPAVATQTLEVLTRPGEPLRVVEATDPGEKPAPSTTYYGADFRHVAVPTKPIVGVVRDRDTGRPLAGVTIRSWMRADSRFLDQEGAVRATTDARGRYRLAGMPKGPGNRIVALPGEDQPYFLCAQEVIDSPGLDPVAVDFRLRRGVWIEGKITDKVTGRPAQASVEYFALYANPNLRDYPGFDGAIVFRAAPSKKDGSYRLVGIPGPGLVVVWHASGYLRVPDRDDEFGVRESLLKQGTAPYWLLPFPNYTAFAWTDPPKGVETVKRDITLDPGWKFTGTVVGPDGKPLTGVQARGLGGPGWWDREMASAEFEVSAFNPRRPRDVLFRHVSKNLVGLAHPPPRNGAALTVHMQPGGVISGRLIDARGRPRPGVELDLLFRPEGRRSDWQHFPVESFGTDREGRFRIAALLPGREYRLSDRQGELSFRLASGVASAPRVLGDVCLRTK